MCKHILLITNSLRALSTCGYSGTVWLWHNMTGGFILFLLEVQRALLPAFCLGICGRNVNIMLVTDLPSLADRILFISVSPHLRNFSLSWYLKQFFERWILQSQSITENDRIHITIWIIYTYWTVLFKHKDISNKLQICWCVFNVVLMLLPKPF